MKKRRNLLLVLLLISALAIGVGYAAISDVLVIDGTIAAVEQEFNLVYVSYAHDSASSTDNRINSSVSGDIAGNRSASLTVTGLDYTDDKAVGTFTVQNNNEVTLYVKDDAEQVIKCGDSPTELNTNGGCTDFDLTVIWDPKVGGGDVHTDGIEPGETATFKVTITLTDLPDGLGITESTFHHYFSVSIPATSTAPGP